MTPADRKASPWSGPRLTLDGQLDGPPPACPGCGARLDRFFAVDLSGARPKDGDLSICAHCAEILLYRADPLTAQAALTVHRPEGDERILLLADPKVQRIRVAALRVIKERGAQGGFGLAQ